MRACRTASAPRLPRPRPPAHRESICAAPPRLPSETSPARAAPPPWSSFLVFSAAILGFYGVRRQIHLAPQQPIQHRVLHLAAEVIAPARVAFPAESEALEAADRGVVARI